jgi:hypothetical protein
LTLAYVKRNLKDHMTRKKQVREVRYGAWKAQMEPFKTVYFRVDSEIEFGNFLMLFEVLTVDILNNDSSMEDMADIGSIICRGEEPDQENK